MQVHAYDVILMDEKLRVMASGRVTKNAKGAKRERRQREGDQKREQDQNTFGAPF
jgi:cytochrome b subunit of formate dehydrogenase